LISSTIFANFPSLYQRIGLQRSTQRLALVLRRTQNMASGVRQAPTSPPKIPPAFGVYLGPEIPAGSYAVFADFHPPGSPNGVYDSDSDKDFLLEQNKFEPGIVVSSLVFPSGSGSETSITFSVPAGAAKIIKGGAGSAEENSLEIVLISRDGQTRRVVVKNTGQIYTK
ncbi:MAG: hypothetical protein HYT42_01945, partial [Candidatus Sungbacteria bacterium]|nr:hypothetical protein [Candidatus Sungbacteria bacterium]